MKQLNDEILKSTNEMWADRPVVFGDGDKNAIIMLIGEAPGAEEVKEGRPFVGKAGKNLNEFLEILGLKERKSLQDRAGHRLSFLRSDYFT